MTNELKKLAERTGYEVIYTESGNLAKYDGKMCVMKNREFLAYDPANNPKQYYELQDEFKIGVTWSEMLNCWIAVNEKWYAKSKTIGEAITACAIGL